MVALLPYLLGIWSALVELARAVLYLDELDPLHLHGDHTKWRKRAPKRKKAAPKADTKS